MSPSSSHSFPHLFRSSRSRSRSGAAMGCEQGKPSKGSPARSDGFCIDRLKPGNSNVPSRLSDPLPTAPAAKEAHARRAAAVGMESDKDRRTESTTDDAATTMAAVPPQHPPPPRRREDELVDGWPTWLLDNVPPEALQGIVPKSADAYDKIEKVGQGTYSNVYKARERGTGRIVALKKVRFDTSESESVRFMAREMRILRRLDHPNVIRLEGMATSRMDRSIYLVFDFMYSDLTRVICRPGQRLTEPQVGPVVFWANPASPDLAPLTTASASTSGAPAASSPRCSSASRSCPAEPRLNSSSRCSACADHRRTTTGGT